MVLKSKNKLMSAQVRFCDQMCFGNKYEKKNTFNLRGVWISKLNIDAYVINYSLNSSSA